MRVNGVVLSCCAVLLLASGAMGVITSQTKVGTQGIDLGGGQGCVRMFFCWCPSLLFSFIF
jgi:hypothetical protein